MSKRAALAAVLAVLAAAAGAQSADDLARAGRAAFGDAQYAQAVRSFQQILDDHPASARAPEAAYLLGASLYLLDRPQEAVDRLEALRRASPGSPLALQAGWWLGAAYVSSGRAEKALAPLAELADAAGADPSWRQRARLLGGVALEELGRTTEAAAAYRALAADGPAEPVLAEARYRLAGIEYRAGRWTAARDLYARVLADHPGSAFVRDAVFFLAECEYALEADISAEKRYRTLLSVYPDSPYRETATFRIAGILARTGRTDAAMEQLDAYLASWPRGAWRSAAYRLQGDILFGRKRHEDALARYEKSLAVASDEPSRQATRLAMGIAQAALGRRDQAASLLAQAASGPDPSAAARAQYEQGALLAGLGRDGEAATALSAYVARFPAGADREAALRLLASVLERRGDAAGAWVRWDELVRAYPRSTLADEHLFRRAGAALRADRIADAIADYTRLGKDFPSSAWKHEASYGLGYAYARRGEYSRALPYFEAALAGAGGGGDLAARAQLGLGVARFNLGSYDKALADFEALRRRARGIAREAEATLHAARTLYRLERFAEAATRFREAADLGGDGESEARYWLGWSLFRQNRPADARDAFLDAARRFPSEPRRAEMVYRAGVCETLLGRDREAVGHFDGALAVPAAPLDVREQALYEKGWALARTGDAAGSTAAFERLAREHPGGTLAPDAFTKLATRALEQGRPADARDLFLRVTRDFPASPLADPARARAAEAALAAGDAAGAADLAWAYVVARPQGTLLDVAIDTFGRALAGGGAASARAWDAKVKAATAIPAGTAARLRLACASRILADAPAEALAILTEVRSRPLADRAAAEAGLLAGRYHVAVGDTARALETLDALAASRADRIGAEARLVKARLLESIGRTGEAVEALLDLGYLYPDIEDLAAEALAEAARIARARGERDRARTIEDRLRKEYPGSPEAQALQPAR